MKKWLLMVCCLLLMPALSHAAVPDELLHEAVMTLAWEDDSGECWVEGHVVLGEKDMGDTTEVYTQVCYENYGFMDGVFTDTGGGSIHPAVFVFENTADGYRLREIKEPEDGENNYSSLQAIMPQKYIDLMRREGEAITAEMKRQMTEQAQQYLDSIGRTEAIEDWRKRELSSHDMLVQASNLVLALKPPYPLWLTTTERVENGVRYVYSHEWYPDEHSPDGYTYVAADGSRHSVGGRTGYAVLRKKRYDTGEYVEHVTITVKLYSLDVIFSDNHGEIHYLFDYDGKTYRKPKILRYGDCQVSYPNFERYAMAFPEADETFETTAEIREENGTRALVITSQLPNGNVVTTVCPKAVRMEGAVPQIEVSGSVAPHIRLIYENRMDDFAMDETGVWSFTQSHGYNMEYDFFNYAVQEQYTGQKGALQVTQMMGDEGAVTVFPTLLMEEGFDFRAETFDISALPHRHGAITPERAQRYVDEYLPEGLTGLSGSMGSGGIGILARDTGGQKLLFALREEKPGRFAATKGNPVPNEAEWDDGHTWGALNLDLYGAETAYCQIGLQPDGKTWGVTYIGGVDWFELHEHEIKMDDRRMVGEHPWSTLDTADLTHLPMTFQDAVHQLDTSRIAVVHNPDPADRLHLRAHPKKGAKSLGKYYNGTIVECRETKGDWVRVTIAGIDGWMMKEFLAFGAAIHEVDPAFPQLTLREEAVEEGVEVISSATDGVITHVFWDMPADGKIIGVVGEAYYHVIYEENGVQGYVRQDCFWEGNG